MEYKLIDKSNNQTHLCNKVTIDEFDYYVNDEKYVEGELLYCIINDWLQKARVEHLVEQKGKDNPWKKVIATNNPNIDIPKVVDEDLGLNYLMSLPNYEYLSYWVQDVIKKAYNKSQETHPFSEEDMIEFAEWLQDLNLGKEQPTSPTKEILQLWKEEQPKIVYYE